MFRRILAGFDGSDHSRRAAEIAGDLARRQTSAEMRLVCVMEPIPGELGQPYLDKLIAERKMAGEKLILEARELLGDGFDIHEELLFGSPAETILEVAKSQDCDLIIMGTRGLGGLAGLLLGSQIQKVIQLADCPVLAVK